MVITQTIRFNKKEGFKIAAAPVIADVPIVLIALFVVSKLTSFSIASGIISMLGYVYFGREIGRNKRGSNSGLE
jgi:threonine/homoserine/homoserine lactone efflux protein